MLTNRYLGRIGDRNPLDHGGGIVLARKQNEHRWTSLEYFQPADDDGTHGTLYQVDVPPDVFAEHNDDPKQLARFTGMEAQELIEHGSSTNPVVRAEVIQLIAKYTHWAALDDSPQHLTRAQIRRRWASWLDRRPTPRQAARKLGKP